MHWLGLDVGGAHLKAADGRGFAASRWFPLWQRPADLAAELGALIADSPDADGLAVTMTGELADCFATKREGVEQILAAVQRAAEGRTVRVFRCDGSWADAAAAREQPLLAAASNWRALAAFAGRFAPRGLALLVDVGSTTTDVVPLLDGSPAPRGLTDPERLACGELVYTGVERTPVCAVVDALPWRGRACPVAAEVFATAWDAWLVLGELPEQPECCHTADGRAATRNAARDRLARAICADRDLVSAADTRAAAETIAAAQLKLITVAAERVAGRLLQRPQTIVLSGSGSFLARRVARQLGRCALVCLDEQLGRDVSRAAPAHAAAVLAAEDAAR